MDRIAVERTLFAGPGDEGSRQWEFPHATLEKGRNLTYWVPAQNSVKKPGLT
jgi:hypothetical protein